MDRVSSSAIAVVGPLLTSMLLNVVQKQQAELTEQRTSMRQQIAAERAKRIAIEERLSKLEQTIVALHSGARNIQAAFNR